MGQEAPILNDTIYFKAYINNGDNISIEYFSMAAEQYEALISGEARLNRKMLYMEPMEVVYGIIGCCVLGVEGYASKIRSIKHIFVLDKEENIKDKFINQCKSLGFYNNSIQPKILIKYPGYLMSDKEVNISAENIIKTEEIFGAIISNNMVVIEMAMKKFLTETLNIDIN